MDVVKRQDNSGGLAARGTAARADQSRELLARLAALRRTVRRRLAAYGVFAVLAGGIAAFLSVVTLDWLIWLPPLLRAFGTFCFVAGFVGAMWYWVILPLQARIGIDELAGQLEQHFEPLQDRLSSTVNFLASGETTSSRMAREVVASTEQMVREVQLEHALSRRPVAARAGVFVVFLVVLITLVSIVPGWAATGVRRYASPWGDVQWPKTVEILPLSGDQSVAIGDSATVRMKVERGLSESLRATVRLRESSGNTKTLINTLALQHEDEGVFSTTLDAVTENMEYWFEAGDDSTESRSSRINVVPRPEVVEAIATIEPPAYATNRVVRVLDLADGPAAGPMGGEVTIAVRSSKGILPESRGASGLRRDDGGLIVLTPDANDNRQLSARFALTGDLNFRIELRDADGFENRGSASYAIRATPDLPPTVSILSPQAVTELTPRGSVQVSLRAEDDFGITGLGLHVTGPKDTEPTSIDLANAAKARQADQFVEWSSLYDWQVESLAASPGDVFVYTAFAVDNRGGDEKTGQMGQSSPMRLKFVSESELELRIREDLALVESRLRQTATEQSDLRDRTASLTRDPRSPLAPKDIDAIDGLSGAEARLSRQLRELAGKLDAARVRMSANRVGDADTVQRIASVSKAVESIALIPMTSAAAALTRSHDSPEAARQQSELQAAIAAQDSAVDQLHTVIKTLSQWGAFQGLLSRARDLLDRQSEIQQKTGELGQSTLGKTVESLSADEAASLRRLQRQQDQLAGDVGQQLARMQQLSETAREKDPAGAESIDAALRAARALDAVKHARAAGEAIEGNRTAAATLEQKAAARALRKMIDALRDRESRELAELRKRIERAEDEVSALLEEQKQLRAATIEAVRLGLGDQQFNALSDTQSTLERNTRMLGDEMMDMERAISAGRLVRQAATPMNLAVVALSGTNGEEASKRQTEAIDSLQHALDDLRALAQSGEEEAFRRTLEHVEEQLDSLLADQLVVNKSLGTLRAALPEGGKLSRNDAREAAKLARDQGDLRTRVEDLLPELQQVSVYQWAMQRVAKWMDESRSSLEERRIDNNLVATTDRIARELKKLLGAIADTRELPLSSEFTEADSSGDSDSQDSVAVPVPTVAELLVLRAMQTDINSRTRAIHATSSDHEASESDLRELQTIGEDQAEVRRLTEMVTKRSQR